jgi:hypothetical protein
MYIKVACRMLVKLTPGVEFPSCRGILLETLGENNNFWMFFMAETIKKHNFDPKCPQHILNIWQREIYLGMKNSTPCFVFEVF